MNDIPMLPEHDCFGNLTLPIGKAGDFLTVSGTGIAFAQDSNRQNVVTFGHDFQTAIHKEIKSYLKHNLEIDMFRWKDDSEHITVQVVLDGKVLSEKTFLLG